MKLEIINRWLRRVGLLLVVQVDDVDGPISLHLIRASRYPLGGAK